MSLPLRLTSLSAVAGLALLSGCSSTPVQAKAPAQAESAQCKLASKSWPKSVSGLDSYPTSAKSDSVKAWGEDNNKAVIARCGVAMPAPTTDACISVDDVDWIQQQFEGGYQFTTYGRSPAIEVLIPTSVSATPAMLLPAFTKSATAIKQGSHRCS